MTRRVVSEKLEHGYVVKTWCESEPEAAAVQAAILSVPKPAAFIPALAAGPAFDSAEGVFHRAVILSDGVVLHETHSAPPNCGLPPSGYAEDYIGHAPGVGEVLARAQHEAAVDGDECTSAVCAMTRGAGD